MKHFTVILHSFLALSLLSCTLTAEGKYSDILEKFSKGEIEDTSVITESLLEGFSLSTVNGENIFISKNAVITVNGSEIHLVFPEEVKLNADQIISNNILYADTGKDRIVLGNRNGFCIFDSDGDPVAMYRADKKENIDSAALRGSNAVFFTGGRINELSDSEKKVKTLDSGVYNAPYRKLYRASMVSSEQYYGIITGIAGSYYISVFDMKEGSVRVKNIAASSFEFNLKDDYLLYIRGGTGVWSVIKYDIPAKKRNELKTLGKIADVYLAEEGFIYISDKRTYIENLSGEKWEAPAELNVKGICRNSVIVYYNSKTYIIDFNILYEKIREFSMAKGEKNS